MQYQKLHPRKYLLLLIFIGILYIETKRIKRLTPC